MTKTIKFNLLCDGCPVRTIEDLQHHFSIEDILGYYNNGLLEKWLLVRGYQQELERVKKLKGTVSSNEDADIQITKALISIFNVLKDENEVDECLFTMKYKQQKAIQFAKFEEYKYKNTSIVNEYFAHYNKLVSSILENPDNMPMIKASIKEIADDYLKLFELDHRRVFYLIRDEYTLNNQSPLAFFCLLANEKTRSFFLPKDETELKDNKDKSEMHAFIINNLDKMAEKCVTHLKKYDKGTDSLWKDIEDPGKKFMIIAMSDRDCVRSGVSKEEYKYKDVKNKFIILEGILYQNASSNHSILYMEA